MAVEGFPSSDGMSAAAEGGVNAATCTDQEWFEATGHCGGCGDLIAECGCGGCIGDYCRRCPNRQAQGLDDGTSRAQVDEMFGMAVSLIASRAN